MSRIKDIKRKKELQLKKRPPRIIIGTILTLVLLFIIVGAIKSAIKTDEKPNRKKTEQLSEPSVPKDEAKTKIENVTIPSDDIQIAGSEASTTTLTISSVGDCTLGTDESFNQATSLNAFYNAHGHEYFFQNVRPIFEQDDLTIANMEGTLTDETMREAKTYAFKGPAEYSSILTSGSVEVANLANNHSSDYGKQSYADTIDALNASSIPSCGFDRALLLDIKGVKVGVTGIYELADHLDRKEQVKKNISALKKAGAQLIIINFHWGFEREYTPNDVQKTLAHLAIDQGADLVIGHHPHVLQGIEKYKEKYIAYSLGNFCFGGNSNPQDKDTIIFQQTFTFNKGKLTKDDNTNIIPCSISSSSGLNDYCPTPLEGSEKERVLEKIKNYGSEL